MEQRKDMAQIVLREMDPGQFRNRMVAIKLLDGTAYIHPLLPLQNFQEMMRHRKPLDQKEMYHNFASAESSGYNIANLGVSAILTIPYQGNDYLLLARQERKDFRDSVAKLVSGYTPDRLIYDPLRAIEQEIAEEVLPMTADRKVIRFARGGNMLPTPFSDIFEGSGRTISLEQPAAYAIPGLEHKVHISSGSSGEEGSPSIIFHAPTNSANLVYSYSLAPQDSGTENAIHSIEHSEDVFDAKTGTLQTRIKPGGLLLCLLDKGRLTPSVYTLQDGRLQAVDPSKLQLSEAFVPKEHGIADANNIPYLDFLRQQ